MPARRANRILARGSWSESTRIAEILRKETVGGALLLLATVIALVWVNSPAGDSYTALRDYTVGPAALHLHLSLGTWSADGLLAIFFFVVGLGLDLPVGAAGAGAAADDVVAAALGGRRSRGHQGQRAGEHENGGGDGPAERCGGHRNSFVGVDVTTLGRRGSPSPLSDGPSTPRPVAAWRRSRRDRVRWGQVRREVWSASECPDPEGS